LGKAKAAVSTHCEVIGEIVLQHQTSIEPADINGNLKLFSTLIRHATAPLGLVTDQAGFLGTSIAARFVFASLNGLTYIPATLLSYSCWFALDSMWRVAAPLRNDDGGDHTYDF
jgi:hypothetical protein